MDDESRIEAVDSLPRHAPLHALLKTVGAQRLAVALGRVEVLQVTCPTPRTRGIARLTSFVEQA